MSIRGLRFGVRGLRFGVRGGLEFGIWNLEFGVGGLGFSKRRIESDLVVCGPCCDDIIRGSSRF